MSKKTDHYSFDDDTDDFDWGDGDFEDQQPAESKGRSPIKTLIGSFSSGVSGAVRDTDNQRRFIKEALPDGYVDTYDGALTAASGIRDVYREAGSELRKVNDETKNAVRKLLPHVKSVMPKSIGNRLERYAGPDRSREPARDYESESIAFELDSLFKSDRIDAGTRRRLEDMPVKSTSDAVEMTENIVSNKLSMKTNDGIAQLVKLSTNRANYFNEVGVKLERKKIELGYRQLFSQTKMLDTLQQTLAYQQSAFKDIIHNTALPDLVKQEQNEVFHDITRRNFYGKLAEPVSNGLSGFIHTMVGKSKQKFTDAASDFTQNLSMGADAMELYFEMKQLEKEMEEMDADLSGAAPLTPEQIEKKNRLDMLNQLVGTGGTMAGGAATQWASRKVSKYMKDNWGDDERVQRWGLAGKNLVDNAGGYGKEFLDNLYGAGPLGKFFEYIGMDSYDLTKSQSDLIQKSNLDHLRQRATYTYKTERTINTVIPELLSMIHNEIRVFRTGDTSLEPMSYDFERDMFSERAVKRQRILDRVYDQNNLTSARDRGQDLLKTLQDGASTQLSPEAQQGILKYAFDKASRGEVFNLRDLLGFDSGLDPAIEDEVREWLEREVGISSSDVLAESGNNDAWKSIKADAKASLKYQKLRVQLGQDFRSLTGSLPNDFESALDIAKQEDLAMLRELGLVKETSPGTWTYNKQGLFDRLFGASPNIPAPPGTPSLPNMPGYGAPPIPPTAPPPTTSSFDPEVARILREISTESQDINATTREIASHTEPVPNRIDEVLTLLRDMAKSQEKNQRSRQSSSRSRGRRDSITGRGGMDVTPAEPKGRSFFGGGYTGTGSKYEIAGATHRGEIVFSKEDIARNGGLAATEAIRLGRVPGYASGGVVGGMPADAGAVPRRPLSEVFTDTSTTMTDRIVAAIEASSTVSDGQLKTVNENLDELAGLVASGLTEFDGMRALGAASTFIKRPWLRRAWSKSKSGVRQMLSWQMSIFKAPFQAAAAVSTTVLGAITGSKDRLVSIGEDLKDKAVDLYIKGSDKVALTAKDIKSRTLIDVNTGQLIEKISDITGEVRDQTGKVVLQASDFAEGLFSLQKGSRIPKLIAGGVDLAKRGAKFIGGGMLSAAALPMHVINATKRVWKATSGILGRMPDIYVAGETTPRLLATLLNNGGYILSATGKPITSVRDIIGEVKTLDGNIVLTHEDIAKGLVDQNGKEIKLLRDRAMDLARKAIMLPVNIAMAGGRIALAPLKLAGKLAGRIGRFGMSGRRAVTAAELTNSWLEHIHELLDDRLAKKERVAGDSDGDGDRDGSALDRIANAATDPKDAKDPTKPTEEKKEDKSWIGKLMTLIGGGFAAIKGFGLATISWLKRIAILNAASKAGGAMSAGGGAGGRGGKLAGLGRGLAIGATAYGAYSMYNGANSMEEKLRGDADPLVDPVTGAPMAPPEGEGEAAEEPGFLENYGGVMASLTGGVAAEYAIRKAYGAWRNRGAARPPVANATGAGSRLSSAWQATRGTLGRAATAVGRQAAWQGIRTAAVAGATALAGIVSAPVLIGAAVVTAVAVGGYMAYKYVTRDRNYLQNFRMNQYGFKEKDEKRCEVIMKLEKMLLPHVNVNQNAVATLGRGVKVEAVAELFSVDLKNRDQVNKLITWFNLRFKPIFLGAVTVYYSLTKNKDIHDADNKLTKDQKVKYLNDTHITTGGGQNPYMVAASPFADDDMVKLDYGNINTRYKEAVDNVGDLSDDKSSGESQSTEKTKDQPKSSWWQSTKNAVSEWFKSSRDTLGNVASSTWSGIKSAYNSAVDMTSRGIEVAANVGSNVMQGASDAVSTAANYATNVINKLSGKQSETQLSVYKAFLNAGFSKNQAMALTAEVGRENDYVSKFVFGGHTDAARDKNGNPISNLGFISWNRGRRTKLIERAKAAGVLTGPNQIAENQAGLDVMAKYVMEEMQGDYRKSMSSFLANKNIDPEAAAAEVGRKYIGWAYGQSVLRGGAKFDWKKHDAKRRGHLNALIKQIGNGAELPETSSTSNAVATGGGGTFIPYRNVEQAQASKASTNAGTGGGGSSATGGNAATSKAQAPAQETPSSPSNVKADANLVAIGKKNTRAQKGVNIQGMNQSFMTLFYAMVGEYFQRTGRGVLVTSAFRTVEQQKVLYDAYLRRNKRPPQVARPGNSRHNSGVAIDINIPDADALNSQGLLKKYSFHRPVRGEAWHLENHKFARGQNTQVMIDNDKTTKAATAKPATAAKPATHPAPAATRAATAAQPANASGFMPVSAKQVFGTDTSNLTREINETRIANGTNPARVAAQAQAAQSINQERVQAHQQAVNAASDAHLKLIEGTNKRLDKIYDLLVGMSKKETKGVTGTTVNSAATQQPSPEQQPTMLNQMRNAPVQVSDPISMKKNLLL